MSTIYTEKEKAQIRKTLDVILDDLEEIWNLNLINDIVVQIKLPDIKEFDSSFPADGWYFFLNETGVGIGNKINSSKNFAFALRKSKGKLKRYYQVDEREVMFFKEYDYIREEIMKQLIPLQEKKQKI